MQCTNCGKNSPDAVYDPGSQPVPGRRSELRHAWYCPECAQSRRNTAETFYWVVGIAVAMAAFLAFIGFLRRLIDTLN
jgi:rubredoxin